jgi:hypothetical protein
VLLGLNESGLYDQEGLIFRGGYNVTLGMLDADPNPEIIISDRHGLAVLGLGDLNESRTDRVYGEPPRSWQQGRPYKEAWLRDDAAKELMMLCRTVKNNQRDSKNIRKTFDALAGYCRFNLGDRILKDIQDIQEKEESNNETSGYNQNLLSLIRADLCLLEGRYKDAKEKYKDVLEIAEPYGIEGLESINLSLEDKSNLSSRMMGRGKSVLTEDFESERKEWSFESNIGWDWEEDLKIINRDIDKEGFHGGSYQDDCFAVLKAEFGGYQSNRVHELVHLTSHEIPHWTGDQSFRLSFHVYVSKLYYATAFNTVLIRSDQLKEKEHDYKNLKEACYMGFHMAHGRNSPFIEGDRYKVEMIGSVNYTIRTGNFASEFPLGHWLKVTFEYIKELKMGHLFIHHMDRHPDSGLVSAIHLNRMTEPEKGPYKIRFSLTRDSSLPAEGTMPVEVFIDDVRFELF